MSTESYSKDPKTVGIISSLLLSVAVLIALLFTGCATAPPQVRGSATLHGLRPSLLLTGPASGHWAEESEHPVITYKVRGTNCGHLATQVGESQVEDHGVFTLGVNESFCVLQLRRDQRVLFHAER